MLFHSTWTTGNQLIEKKLWVKSVFIFLVKVQTLFTEKEKKN